MSSLATVVLGAGMAGLAAALALARDGHRVTLVERDPVEAGDPLDSIAWPRAGIPHFLQPHAFIPRGRRELRAAFPDVFASLLDAGSWDVDLRPKMPGPPGPDDEELAYIGVRRPLIEWALRRAVLAEEGIRVLSGVRATGLLGERGAPARVSGVATSAGDVAAGLVVDAMGRRSPVGQWIESLGGRRPAERSSDCGIIYYSRYYRVRPRATLPDSPSIPGPRGDLGYGVFSTFPGDNGTFAAIIAIPPGDQALKGLRHAAAFEAAASTMPSLHTWTNADTSEPITGVLPMGSLRNTIREPGTAGEPTGLVVVGDALCHTDPVLAMGLSFSLIQAQALALAVREHGDDVREAALAFDGAVRPEIEERYQQATDLDEARARRWAGEAVDLAHHDGGSYQLFLGAAGFVAALVDPEVFRAVVRRHTLLDRVGRLDRDVELLRRIERIYAEATSRPRAPAGPSREELVGIVAAATPVT